MQQLQGKRIVLGVAGGIAAFKAAALASKLAQAGAHVDVIMTENAGQFVQPLTFQALTHRHVYADTFVEPDPGVIAHIELADKADLVVVAPATANLIGKLANGIADNMLTSTLLATKAPVLIAPAMNVNMYEHPAVQANMKRLAAYGYRFLEPNEGLLACGWIGKGRLAEPEEIFHAVTRFLTEEAAGGRAVACDWTGKKVLITAGPTREKIDPVRYISNHSTGKMGYAIAEAARDRGADVVLVSGPVALPKPDGVTIIAVESVQQMYDAVMQYLPEVEVVIKSAAVSDYRPKTVSAQKMKKTGDDLTLELEKAPDILAEVGERKTNQFVVGFAAETHDVLNYAADKLARKNLDMIVANDVLQEGAGMGTDTNIVTILAKNSEPIQLGKMSKREVADKLLDAILAKQGEAAAAKQI